MALTREQTANIVCGITALAYQSVGDYQLAADGFCPKCQELHGEHWHFQHSGNILAFVRDAVIEKLEREGYPINVEIPGELLEAGCPAEFVPPQPKEDDEDPA